MEVIILKLSVLNKEYGTKMTKRVKLSNHSSRYTGSLYTSTATWLMFKSRQVLLNRIFKKRLLVFFLQQDLNQFLNGTLHNYILKVEVLIPHCCNKLHLFPLESKGFLKWHFFYKISDWCWQWQTWYFLVARLSPGLPSTQTSYAIRKTRAQDFGGPLRFLSWLHLPVKSSNPTKFCVTFNQGSIILLLATI